MVPKRLVPKYSLTIGNLSGANPPIPTPKITTKATINPRELPSISQKRINPALVKAYQTKRHVKVIRYEDDTNRGRINDKFEIDKHLLEWMRPLPKVDFE